MQKKDVASLMYSRQRDDDDYGGDDVIKILMLQ